MKRLGSVFPLANRILSGWISIARAVGLILIGLCVTAGLGVVVVLPLWLLASQATTLYNTLIGLLVAALLSYSIFRRLFRGTSRSLLPIVKRGGVVVAGLGGVYIFAIFIWEGVGWAAALVAAIYLVWVGIVCGNRSSQR